MEQSPLPSHIVVGATGERLALKFLLSRSFLLLERNYRKQWGEIDLIVKKAEIVHFVEVKTVSYETSADMRINVSRGTSNPEQNVHSAKLERLSRAIETWVSERKYQGDYQLDVVTVRMVSREKKAVIDFIEHVSLN